MAARTARRTSSASSALVAAMALIGAGAAIPQGASADEPAPLRLCADPSNPPFSTDDPANPGLYVEIGEALGRALGRPVTHVWYRTYFGGRAVRVTLLAKQCDAMIGLPDDKDFMGPRVIFSKPILTMGFAVVLPPRHTFKSLDDLAGTRVAVQFSTAPQNILASRDDITAVTVLSPEEGMQALADGRADAAFLWGPSAGYLNQTTYKNGYTIVPVDGPGLSWDAGIGFPRSEAELRDAVDAALPGLKATIGELGVKYGFPFGKHAPLAAPAEPVQQAAIEPAPAAVEPASSDAAPPAATPEAIAAGKEVFNGTCAHCHGPNAEQSDKHIDLRRLELRYGADDMYPVFWKTVHEGRPSKGMPIWAGIFTDAQLRSVYAYLSTLQSKE